MASGGTFPCASRARDAAPDPGRRGPLPGGPADLRRHPGSSGTGGAVRPARRARALAVADGDRADAGSGRSGLPPGVWVLRCCGSPRPSRIRLRRLSPGASEATRPKARRNVPDATGQGIARIRGGIMAPISRLPEGSPPWTNRAASRHRPAPNPTPGRRQRPVPPRPQRPQAEQPPPEQPRAEPRRHRHRQRHRPSIRPSLRLLGSASRSGRPGTPSSDSYPPTRSWPRPSSPTSPTRSSAPRSSSGSRSAPGSSPPSSSGSARRCSSGSGSSARSVGGSCSGSC
jgi:hypothetical protein